MQTPAQKFRARLAAQQAMERHEALTVRDSLHLQLAQLEIDCRAVSSCATNADRVAFKRESLLPRWMPTIEAWLQSGEEYKYIPFTWCIVWLFDTGEMDKALEWADIAIGQNQPMPPRFDRDLPTFVADEVMQWAQIQFDKGLSVEPYFSRVMSHIEKDWTLHEDIVARWYKFAGLNLLRDSDGKPTTPAAIYDVAKLRSADEWMARAHSTTPKAGVRAIQNKIAARLRALRAV
ncbi:terminase [Escherichia coli]|uniref:phage terminase small subunit n=1 Tax=Enterobacteriaceae TaxID=543 RepID=UPI00062C4243|nr:MULTISPECIES: phage terminase small subunit [Enterobacteriaceae]EFW9294974.1 terminase [Shigella flexneri]AKH22527.1 terminase [Escherichia coli]EAC0484031.1 terminase [Escherichia coli]EEW8937519.1 terminase [Escherichia coli]EFB2249387.1 terminase [Escherichia coli]